MLGWSCNAPRSTGRMPRHEVLLRLLLLEMQRLPMPVPTWREHAVQGNSGMRMVSKRGVTQMVGALLPGFTTKNSSFLAEMPLVSGAYVHNQNQHIVLCITSVARLRRSTSKTLFGITALTHRGGCPERFSNSKTLQRAKLAAGIATRSIWHLSVRKQL